MSQNLKRDIHKYYNSIIDNAYNIAKKMVP